MTFNPHNNTTSNGQVIVVGMTVRDYDYMTGTVVEDSTSSYLCCVASGNLSPDDGAMIQHVRANDLARDGGGQSGTCAPACSHDHWFTVERENGTTKDFNGSRLVAR